MLANDVRDGVALSAVGCVENSATWTRRSRRSTGFYTPAKAIIAADPAAATNPALLERQTLVTLTFLDRAFNGFATQHRNCAPR
jgi:hypothetical protein